MLQANLKSFSNLFQHHLQTLLLRVLLLAKDHTHQNPLLEGNLVSTNITKSGPLTLKVLPHLKHHKVKRRCTLFLKGAFLVIRELLLNHMMEKFWVLIMARSICQSSATTHLTSPELEQELFLLGLLPHFWCQFSVI